METGAELELSLGSRVEGDVPPLETLGELELGARDLERCRGARARRAGGAARPPARSALLENFVSGGVSKKHVYGKRSEPCESASPALKGRRAEGPVLQGGRYRAGAEG